MLGWLVSSLGIGLLRNSASNAAGQIGRRIAIFATLAALWVTALGFLIAALTVWLVGAIGVIAGLVIMAAGLAIVGLALYLGSSLSARRKPTPVENVATAVGTGLVGAEIGSLGSLAVIAAAGFLLARQMHR
jgi:hypothetical protein